MSDSTTGIFCAHILRESMDAHGMSSRELSSHVGLGVNMVSAIRTGKKAPSLETLTRIAALFNRPVTDFLDLPPASDWTLRHYRLAAGLTQAAVADQLGVHSSAVYKWEQQRTRPSEDTLTNLAALYNVTADHLHQVIDRTHSGPTEQILALTESVRALAEIGIRAVLRDPDSPKRQQTVTDIRSRIIHALGILNAAIPHLDNGTLTRAKRTIDQLVQTLNDTAEK